MERAAACDLDWEDGDAEIKEHYDHVKQWISELPPPEPSSGYSRICRTPVLDVCSGSAGAVIVQAAEANPSEPGPSGSHGIPVPASETKDVVPSVSGCMATSIRRVTDTVNDGSDLDSDFDDEFNLDEIAATGGMPRTIPDDEELDEPTTHIVNSIESAMDDVIDQMVGTSIDFEWREDFDSFRGVAEVFSGPTVGPIEDYDTPYDAFTAIWGRDIIVHIVTETNRYAKQVIDAQMAAGTLKTSSRLHKWTDTNEDEMYVFISVLMFMGLDPRTSQHEYWKSTGYLEMPKFRKLIQYNRFILLNKFIHFVNNSAGSQDLSQTEGNLLPAKLRKLAPIIRHLNNKFSSLYNLHPDIAIDESLTLFKGRLSWIQAIRSKSARFGMKSFELCESRTGYLYKFEIYAGKDDSQSHTSAPSVALAGKSASVVIDLLKGLENRGHCVTMDNFYNSPALARYLKFLGFDCLGTLRPNRKHVPIEVKNVPRNVARGSIIARHCGDVSCIAWKDTKVVTMISTYHTPETFVGRKAGRPLIKPVVVRDYNNTMGGVDLKDQKLSMYLIERKRCVKWYMKMFKRLLNASVLNAYIILSASLKRRNMPPMTHRQFREQLANSLVENHFQFPQENLPSSEELTRLRRDIIHVPKNQPRNNRKRCTICYRKGTSKMVTTYCVTCDEYICFESCWLDWHSLQKLPGADKHRRNRSRRE